jgi:hypothetical protein
MTRFSALGIGRLYASGNIPDTHVYYRQSRHKCHCNIGLQCAKFSLKCLLSRTRQAECLKEPSPKCRSQHSLKSASKCLRSIKYDTLRVVAPNRPWSQPIPLYNGNRLTPEGEVVLTTHPYPAIPLLPPLELQSMLQSDLCLYLYVE